MKDGVCKGFTMAVTAKTKYFCPAFHYMGKAGLGKNYWNLKRKLGVTVHFSEIIKFQFGKNSKVNIVLYFNTF